MREPRAMLAASHSPSARAKPWIKGEESSNSALGARGSGSSPVAARRIRGSFPAAAVSGAEAGARGGLTPAAG